MKPKNIKKNIMYVLGGTVLTEDIIVKNIRFIVIIFAIAAFYISNRFSCIEKRDRIDRLQRELIDAKYESNTIAAELMSVSREMKVNELVQQYGLDLERSKEPAYTLKK
ncbi:FtsL-like putative cell division protein [Dysgonomonas massiliensis]|uniref:FtsL-like putative cell division protein n=1 Tax=Dysgonomonas massiliensis TaxID=2040292 RepID=UPI000C78F350|nr:FtsL-like putative cell division protein [Dysgonomonas massiliensis]